LNHLSSSSSSSLSSTTTSVNPSMIHLNHQLHTCYCQQYSGGKYGYICDGYTEFYHDWTFVYHYIIFILIYGTLLIVSVVLLLIPECFKKCIKLRKFKQHADSNSGSISGIDLMMTRNNSILRKGRAYTISKMNHRKSSIGTPQMVPTTPRVVPADMNNGSNSTTTTPATPTPFINQTTNSDIITIISSSEEDLGQQQQQQAQASNTGNNNDSTTGNNSPSVIQPTTSNSSSGDVGININGTEEGGTTEVAAAEPVDKSSVISLFDKLIAIEERLAIIINNLSSDNTCLAFILRLRIFFSERMLMTMNLTLCLLASFIESFYSSVTFITYSYDIPVGLFRILGGLLLLLCYSALLVMWIKVSEKMQRDNRLSARHKILLYIVNISTILGLVVIGIVYVLFSAIACYIVACALLAVFVFVFPFPMTVYGLKMYCNLKHVKNFMHFKFTRFVLVASTTFIVGGIVLTVTLINFILGWDAFGIWYYTSRDIFLDVMMISTCTIMIWLVYHEKNVQMVIRACGCKCCIKDDD